MDSTTTLRIDLGFIGTVSKISPQELQRDCRGDPCDCRRMWGSHVSIDEVLVKSFAIFGPDSGPPAQTVSCVFPLLLVLSCCLGPSAGIWFHPNLDWHTSGAARQGRAW